MKGMYFYKMYGKFDDVTADEFIQVQTDTSDFRYIEEKYVIITEYLLGLAIAYTKQRNAY